MNDEDILLHMDVRPHEHLVVFNYLANNQWGAEVERRLWFGSDFSLDFTLVGHFKIQMSLRSLTEQYLDWVMFELPMSSKLSFSSMNRLQLVCRAEPNCLSIRSLEIAGENVTTTAFRTDHHGRPAHLKTQEDTFEQLQLRSERKTRMFIGVLSAPGYYNRRMGVRESWFQEPAIRSGTVAPRFILGCTTDATLQQQLLAEQLLFGDMEIMDFKDGYYEIAKKTKRIMELAAVNTSADYVLKCDDDSYIFVERLLLELDKIDENVNDKYVYMGQISPAGEPARDPRNQWYISKEDLPGNYPPFAHGPGYVLSRQLAEQLVVMWSNATESAHLPLLRLEDISMAVWIDHLKTAHQIPVQYKKDARFHISGCQENAFVGHYINPKRMACIWGKYSTRSREVCC